MCTRTEHAVVFDNRSTIHDASRCKRRPRIHDRPRGDEHALSQLRCCGDDCAWIDDRCELRHCKGGHPLQSHCSVANSSVRGCSRCQRRRKARARDLTNPRCTVQFAEVLRLLICGKTHRRNSGAQRALGDDRCVPSATKDDKGVGCGVRCRQGVLSVSPCIGTLPVSTAGRSSVASPGDSRMRSAIVRSQGRM